MSCKKVAPNSKFDVSSESHYASKQLELPYPQQLMLDQTDLDKLGLDDKDKRVSQVHSCSTGSSSSKCPTPQTRHYIPIHRAWSDNLEGCSDCCDMGAQSPMDRWQHGSARDGPWDAVGAVDAPTGGIDSSAPRMSVSHSQPEHESIAATKGRSTKSS